MSKSKKEKFSFRKFLARIGITLIAAFGIGSGVKQLNEGREAKAIEEEANYNVGRSLKNINDENMNKNLKEEINELYEKYPNLDELINSNDEDIQNKEFIKDLYILYKINLADDKIEDISNFDEENLKVVEVDRVISQSDRLYYDDGDNTKRILETSAEKYKLITDKYNEAMNDPTKSKELADLIYELLAKENGLKENIPKSSELDKLIERNDFRDNLKYDVSKNEDVNKNEQSNDEKTEIQINESEIDEKE